MNILDLLVYAGVVKAVIGAIKAAKPGEAVSIPEIKGIRVNGRAYTLRNAEAVPE